MIIPLPPVYLTFSTASKPLKSSSSIIRHRLHCQRRKSDAASPPMQPKPPLPKSDTIIAAILWSLLIKTPVFCLS